MYVCVKKIGEKTDCVLLIETLQSIRYLYYAKGIYTKYIRRYYTDGNSKRAHTHSGAELWMHIMPYNLYTSLDLAPASGILAIFRY